MYKQYESRTLHYVAALHILRPPTPYTATASLSSKDFHYPSPVGDPRAPRKLSTTGHHGTLQLVGKPSRTASAIIIKAGYNNGFPLMAGTQA